MHQSIVKLQDVKIQEIWQKAVWLLMSDLWDMLFLYYCFIFAKKSIKIFVTSGEVDFH